MYLLWTSLVAQMVKNPPAMQEPWLNSWDWKIPWRRDRLPTPVFLGFPGGSDGNESICNAGDLGLIPGLGRSPGGGHGNPLQYSDLENPHGQRSLASYSSFVQEMMRTFYVLFVSVQFSRSVVSDSLGPHEPQHTRPPCPSPTPGVHPNTCP